MKTVQLLDTKLTPNGNIVRTYALLISTRFRVTINEYEEINYEAYYYDSYADMINDIGCIE